MAAAIEDYALIGDCETAALVARDGSIDWLCWPRFDSDACFAALLGESKHGRWLVRPVADDARVTRRYIGSTLVLETTFTTSGGVVKLVDFMPPRANASDADASDLIRLVIGESGSVAMRMEFVLRFDYGSTVPWVEKLHDESGISAIAGPNRVLLRTPVKLQGKNLHTEAEFTVRAGETIPFVLTHAPSHVPPAGPIDAQKAYDETLAFWRDWAQHSTYRGPWREAVCRSLITLKALTYRPTGGIVAAPTTSLPEKLGGVRNWDYRYCWIRDATLVLLALMQTGYYTEADEWRSWLLRAVAGDPAQMQIMYGVGGERRLAEWEIPWLPGYQNSKPVRIGNAAALQRQLDVFGELMDALYQGRLGKLQASAAAWGLQTALTNHLEKIWTEPDEGLWETRGGRQQFTFSKVMCWVAVDRAIKTIEKTGVPGPLDKWTTLRRRIHEDICRNGFDPRQNSFVQAYGGKDLDACLLQLPLVGFLPPDDPRIVGTVEAIRRRLVVNGFVLRYDSERMEDGLPAGEGAFLACSFWLADNLVLQGKASEAREIFEHLLSLRNDVGLLSEEYDLREKRLVGNFPQAFSHIALINTALNLSRHDNPATQRGADQPPPAAAQAAPEKQETTPPAEGAPLERTERIR